MRRISFSFDGESDGSPSGYVMDRPGTILYAPTFSAVGTKEVIMAVAIPVPSISLLIAAPQRVPVPQVAVIMAAVTPSRFKSAARALPIFLATSMDIATPVVV
jgi:hypothetical protein